MMHVPLRSSFFFFNDTATTEIYTLSLHDALPISPENDRWKFQKRNPLIWPQGRKPRPPPTTAQFSFVATSGRSEEHTSELQSQSNLVCRLLLEKKNKKPSTYFRSLKQARECAVS